ncbi:RNA polymerase Rpc34 [Coemansia reversa NRRL 1564]|uniref:DNA-directed RNA polymerase III subunit RPC6 n=1 Tax=Coemansia reversa (strain ATCC 12441 / NRRL 1564) TaxID=763665 RepID=A0A2G5BDF1_COERN|nr:RNA polymerase Rpc34 [Coemansia reversa NRRL 1564]|eukprot:PIA17044.1 RNA polymerase Rpc34 [Coemansia reversa NRRL 1564]
MGDVDGAIYNLALGLPNGVEMAAIQEQLPQSPLETIVNGVNRLLKDGKLELLQSGNKVYYRGVSSDEMKLMGAMSEDEKLVYKHIENSGNEGIWVRILKQLTNLPQTVITRSLRALESQVLIKSVKSVKHPTRKLYMLTSVSPSSEITGGPWYTDQEMDTDFIEQLARQCHQFIYAYSYPRHNPEMVYSANHTGYPTATQIKRFIAENRISNVDLSLDNIEELLTMLVYDGKIERIAPALDADMGLSARFGKTDWMYRAQRISSKDSPLTDIPCGRCPVANRCSNTGSITPAKCEYFSQWLSF